MTKKNMYFIFILISSFLQTDSLRISSPDFSNEGNMPTQCTCDGDEINPALAIDGIPAGTKSLALIVEDPEVIKSGFTHWVVWNIEPVDYIHANSIPGTQGLNSVGKSNFMGPCPVAGTHRYFFKVYALNTKLSLDQNTSKHQLEKAMSGHIMAAGTLMGYYNRSSELVKK
jgi:Raf kinase inhibitor-like YbhB/YbcL family protein